MVRSLQVVSQLLPSFVPFDTDNIIASHPSTKNSPTSSPASPTKSPLPKSTQPSMTSLMRSKVSPLLSYTLPARRTAQSTTAAVAQSRILLPLSRLLALTRSTPTALLLTTKTLLTQTLPKPPRACPSRLLLQVRLLLRLPRVRQQRSPRLSRMVLRRLLVRLTRLSWTVTETRRITMSCRWFTDVVQDTVIVPEGTVEHHSMTLRCFKTRMSGRQNLFWKFQLVHNRNSYVCYHNLRGYHVLRFNQSLIDPCIV